MSLNDEWLQVVKAAKQHADTQTAYLYDIDFDDVEEMRQQDTQINSTWHRHYDAYVDRFLDD